MEIRLSGHSAYRTEYHIVWVFKYRRRILNPGLRGYLRKLFPKIIRSLPGGEIIEYNIQIDHIHMAMIIPPKYKVSEVISRIKTQTASRLRKKFLWLSKVYWKENIVWSPGYFVSTICLDEKTFTPQSLSFGFRTNRKAYDAGIQVKHYIETAFSTY
jgi:putative transposase